MYFFRPIQRIIILRTKLIVAQFPCLRWLNIRVVETPNEHAIKFIPEGRQVMGKWKGLNFGQNTEVRCPLAKQLYLIAGVSSVFYGPDFITITKLQQNIWDWNDIKPKVVSLLSDFFDSRPPLENTEAITKEAEEVAKTLTSLEQTVLPEESSKVYCNINEIITNKIRPMLLEDGGDIELEDFNPASGTVTIRLLGSCQNCPSSEETLKSGIENMLKFYVPEVNELIASREPVIFTKADVEKINETKEQKDKDQLIQSKENINKFQEKDNTSIVSETEESTVPLQADNQIKLLETEITSSEPLLVTKQIIDTLNDMCLKHLKSISDKTKIPSNLSDETKQELDVIKEAYEALSNCTYNHFKTFIEENQDIEKISVPDKHIDIIQIISNEAIRSLDSLLLQLQIRNCLSNSVEEIQQDKEAIQSLTYSSFEQLINRQEELSDYEKYMKNLKLQPKANLAETTREFLENLKENMKKKLDSKTPEQISNNSDSLSENIKSVKVLMNTMREETLKRFETIQESIPVEKNAFEAIWEQKEQRLKDLIENLDQREDIDVVRKEIEIEKEIINLIHKESISYLNKFNEITSKNKMDCDENEDLGKKHYSIQQKKDIEDNNINNEERIEEILDDFINEPKSNEKDLNSINFEDHDFFWEKQNQNLISKQILKNQFFFNEIKPKDEMIGETIHLLNEPIEKFFVENIKLDKLIDDFLIKQEEQRIKDYIALEKKIIAENEAKEQTIKNSTQQLNETEDLLITNEKMSPRERVIKSQNKENHKIEDINNKTKDSLEKSKMDEKIVSLLLEQNQTMNKLMDILGNWCQEQNKIGKNISSQFTEVAENLKSIREQQQIYDKKDKKNRKKYVSQLIGKNSDKIMENKDDLKLNLKELLMEIKNNIKEIKSNKNLDSNIGDLYGEIADILGYNISRKLENEHHKLETKQIQQNQTLEPQNNLEKPTTSMDYQQQTLKFPNLSTNYSKNFSQMIILLDTECHNLSITVKEFEMLLAETDMEPERENNSPVKFKEKIQNMRSRKKIQEHQRYLAKLVLDAEFEFTQNEKHMEEMRDALLFLEKELDILKDTAKESRIEFEILEGQSREYLKYKQKILNYVPFARMILENDKSSRNVPEKEIESYFESGSQMEHSKPKPLDMDQICLQAVNAKKEFDNEQSLKKLKILNDNNKCQQILALEEANNLDIPLSNGKDLEKNEKVLNLFDTITNVSNITNQINVRDDLNRRYYIENNIEIKKKPPDSMMAPSFANSHSTSPNMNSQAQIVLETLRKFIHK